MPRALPIRMVSVALVFASGCAGHSLHTATSEVAQSPGEPRAEWREMTWSEYYADVREKAWRNNVSVFWINPPRLNPAKAPRDPAQR